MELIIIIFIVFGLMIVYFKLENQLIDIEIKIEQISDDKKTNNPYFPKDRIEYPY